MRITTRRPADRGRPGCKAIRPWYRQMKSTVYNDRRFWSITYSVWKAEVKMISIVRCKCSGWALKVKAGLQHASELEPLRLRDSFLSSCLYHVCMWCGRSSVQQEKSRSLRITNAVHLSKITSNFSSPDRHHMIVYNVVSWSQDYLLM